MPCARPTPSRLALAPLRAGLVLGWALGWALAGWGTAHAEPPAGGGPAQAPAAGDVAAEEPPLLPSERAPGVPLAGSTSGALRLLGPDPAAALARIPGSGSSVTPAELRKQREVTSLQDAVQSLPGVVTRTEVASGLLPSIGIRGLNPDRCEKLLLLEDGVPAGLAPYAENAAYYVPPFERMARLELLKGSGSLLHGPHTVGGVLNLLTPAIPAGREAHLRTLLGTHGYAMGYVQAGATHGTLGWLVTALAKRGDGWREHASFEAQDLLGKLRWTPSACTELTLKLGAYWQESQDTYLGLTPGLFAADPWQNPVEDDRLEVERQAGQLTLRQQLGAGWQLLANAYAASARRDWNRQDYARNTGFAPAPADTLRTVGDPGVDGGAIYLRASYGSRDRDFRFWGVEPRLVGTHALLGRPAEAHVGLRFHAEQMTDARNNRATAGAAPVTRSRDERSVDAWAFFAQERVEASTRLTLSAGLRVEAYREQRHVTVASGAPVDVRGETDHVEWIPGAGATWLLAPGHTLFAGVHRGFSPPRTAQAIASDGTDLELEPERSWEWELGVRGKGPCGPCPWLGYELTAFLYDFSNQVVPANQSGGAGTADTNAGATRHAGVEGAAQVDLVALLSGRCSPCRTGWFLDLGWTFVDSENTTAGGTYEGLELPYAPRHVGWAGLRVETPGGVGAGLVARYVGAQWSDQANTVQPNAAGTVGRIESHVTLDAMLHWRVPRSRVSATLAVNNLLDEAYVASRAPEGTFPGAPRHGYVGVEVDL